MFQPVLFEQFAPALTALWQGKPAKCAYEGNRLDRFHRRVEAALFGKVADQAGNVLGMVMAEHAPLALVRIDNAQQHAQGGGLARTIGAEDTGDRPLAHGDVHTVHGQRIVETLHQPACNNRRLTLFACRNVHPHGLQPKDER